MMRSVKGVTHNILLMQKEKINEQVNKNGNEVLVPSGKEQKKNKPENLEKRVKTTYFSQT